MFAVDILPCMCLAALWSSVGKGAKAVVAGSAGAAFAGPTFLAEKIYAFHTCECADFSEPWLVKMQPVPKAHVLV